MKESHTQERLKLRPAAQYVGFIRREEASTARLVGGINVADVVFVAAPLLWHDRTNLLSHLGLAVRERDFGVVAEDELCIARDPRGQGAVLNSRVVVLVR